MHDDVILNKTAIIERCILRINEEYDGKEENLFDDFTKQDSIVLNLQRMCEACIDIAMYVTSKKKLGLPQDSKDGFTLLEKANIIDGDLSSELRNMVGFRNIAVHDYQDLNLDIVKNIIDKKLNIFYEYLKMVNCL